MSILLREYIGFDPKDKKKPLSFKESVQPKDDKFALKLLEWQQENPEEYFTTKIEAIHADFTTVNFTRYKGDCLKNSISSWTTPYNVPVIMYHNDYDGEVIGRITEASIEQGLRNPSAKALFLNAKIPHYRTQDNIKNGILDTVSVGMSGIDVRCSICGAKISDGEYCEHDKGLIYNKETCYWDVYEAVAKEISFVIVPSDRFAGVVSWHDPWMEENKKWGAEITRKRSIPLKTSENEHPNASNKELKESCQSSLTITERKTNELELKEAEQKISSLETANQALSGDKAALQKTIDALNNDKIKLQESIKDLEAKLESKELDFTNEKSLREAAEKTIETLNKEVHTSLVDTFVQLRESAGKPAIENIEKRSIDSLRDSIADLRMELKESQEKTKTEKENKDTVEIKNTVNNVSLTEGASKPNESQDKVAPKSNEIFDL